MNFKYLALGICIGYLAPYALAFLKAQKDPASSQPNKDEIIDNHNDNDNY